MSELVSEVKMYMHGLLQILTSSSSCRIVMGSTVMVFAV